MSQRVRTCALLLLVAGATPVARAQTSTAPVTTLVGWAAVPGRGVETTRGGAGGQVVVVRDAAALARTARSAGPLVIQVEGTIEVPRLEVSSRKTLVGRGPGATLRGRLRIHEAHDVIVQDLRIDGSASDDDAVQISRSHHVWLDHCDLLDAPDGNLDIVHGSDHVTVSWTIVRYTDAAPAPDHRFACLIGNRDDSPEDRGALRVTLHHVWWKEGVRERMPRVRYGQVHLFNCYTTSAAASYVIRADVEAAVLVEGSVFEGVRRPHELTHDAATLVARGNLYLRTSGARDVRGDAFAPPYAYELDPVERVADVVRAGAGPRPR